MKVAKRRETRTRQSNTPTGNEPPPAPTNNSPATTNGLKPSKDGLKHVVLLVESSGSYGRGLLSGIAKYNRAHGHWLTYYRPRALSAKPPPWLRSWHGQGMLVRIKTKEVLDAALRPGVPVVNLRESGPETPFPYVAVDNAKVSQMAFEHLRERGFRNFGFCGRPRKMNVALDQRADAFAKIVKDAGFSHDAFFSDDPTEEPDWEKEQEDLSTWVASLPKPVGIMACNDERGRQVLDGCRRAGVVVPDEVAVIGVDNDESLCDLAIPPLSSVDVNAEAIGYEAASLLDRMMGGEKVSKEPLKLPPRGVVVRRSTDVIASEDDEVNAAIRYIREHACKGMQVSDVLMQLGLSRAALQQRMKHITGRTIHQEIQRVRLERAKELLVVSELTIKQVARESGFASVQYMTRVFSSATGETPAKYRAHRAK